MKKLCLLLFLLNFLVILSAQNEQVKSNNPNFTGWLDLKSRPENGVDVYLNEELLGETPLYKEMQYGNYSLRLVKDLYYDTIINIAINRSVTSNTVVMRPKYGFMRIESSPTGAIVLIDGEDSKLKTPCITNKISSGEHELTLLLPDYSPYNQVVNVEDGKISFISIKFTDLMKLANVENDSISADNVLSSNSIHDSYFKKKESGKMPKNTYNELKNKYFRYGLMGGLNYSGIYGKEVSDAYWWEYDFLAGVNVEYLFKKRCGLEIDFIYTRQSYSYNYKKYYQQNNVVINEVDIMEKNVFQYVSIPLLFKCYFNKKWTGFNFELGPQMSYCIDGEFIYKIDEEENSHKFYDNTNFFFDVVAGLSCDIPIGKRVLINIGARYNLSMTTIYQNFDWKFQNLMLFAGIKM